jgi:hypothetical protein
MADKKIEAAISTGRHNEAIRFAYAGLILGGLSAALGVAMQDGVLNSVVDIPARFVGHAEAYGTGTVLGFVLAAYGAYRAALHSKK